MELQQPVHLSLGTVTLGSWKIAPEYPIRLPVLFYGDYTFSINWIELSGMSG